MGKVLNKTRTPTANRRADRATSPRARLLRHATEIFAAKGFAAAGTREICEAAGVNVASIHYYFGDKAGLYRETLVGPITEVIAACEGFDAPALSFEDSMRLILGSVLGLVPDGEALELKAQRMRLYLRERLEPSEPFQEVVEQVIAPAHEDLCGLLARHCGLAAPDDDIHQLAFALVAMANDYAMSRDLMGQLAPGVLTRPRAGERILERLVAYARALLDYEVARRDGATRGRDSGGPDPAPTEG